MRLAGLVLASVYISQPHAVELTRFLKAELDAISAPGDGGKGRSRILRYGHDYDQSHRWLRDVPKELQQVWPESNAVTVNLYPSGHGINPHIDDTAFGDEIRILSLGAPAEMEFTCKGHDSFRILLTDRSMLFMKGDARRHWRHGIAPTGLSGTGERLSVVFRTYHVT